MVSKWLFHVCRKENGQRNQNTEGDEHANTCIAIQNGKATQRGCCMHTVMSITCTKCTVYMQQYTHTLNTYTKCKYSACLVFSIAGVWVVQYSTHSLHCMTECATSWVHASCHSPCTCSSIVTGHAVCALLPFTELTLTRSDEKHLWLCPWYTVRRLSFVPVAVTDKWPCSKCMLPQIP